ncbi:SMI1 / KNR4 family [Serratia ficaria]|uniref:SMI1/KNR4 family protein n=1 Tax=Serratia ficaria TaxID=61651 RepID=UPI002182BD9A|nr:SMI1/KNR4 family protein [Serratia ficaria]CAI2531880.1 SMI1 / KNR4 family [Serratia ficaria]
MPVSCGNGLSDVQISDLEKIYGVHFPNDYKGFLSSYNGFVVKQPDYYEMHCDGVDDDLIAFYALFGLGISNKNNELSHQNNEFLDEIKFIKNVFIIGADPGANYFVLVCEGEMNGVYYWDRTHLHADDDIQGFSIPEVNACGNLYKVHDDFSSFLSELVKNTIGDGMSVNKDL